ncbi:MULTISPECIES: efflux RND transporter periplasmic adaptor subunit [unclassified Gilliamella]|uniref:efflux RND transporter periplasmic adaptor subunit n=1 Tax=unclassified Gilliamella TaxID=2685620 RepID=UPI00226AA293|nr:MULTISPECIES: efflux RND transporter periplasmic adaptor subunit [unclassified Gilliamella]MCX8574762.1 efflux RND transporter periplasmic adaptor subunit [Gilliamella sp. B3831]MCX8576884.1 efflux RND transporter periplasmic adaptor subunit [Gilliamella sp. B3815]MCX8588976.1 efflux RND transporter periplasmic adaptor subunit [Gilliamella sp. B3801]MCX8590486.1 efflux RND transporter periplasmic adaptor subunit [Gilliamella sp. B3812]MCX8592132.1 efflux RND transporter periplasmic adaptor 
MRFNKLLLTIPVALTSLFLLSSCDDNKSQGGNNQIPKVTVFKVEPLNYTLKIGLPGRVVASQIAEIRPQVSGIVLKREFEESSNVKAGQSLYQIDPAIYQANYDSAVASVASAKANASIAQLTLKRYAGLLKTKSISQQDYDKAAADAQQAEASVLVAQAAEHTAKVNLDYTKVYSPIDGYIGKSSVTEGALVSAGQATALALVQKLDPIYVDMTEAATRYNKYNQDQNVIFEPAKGNNVELYFNDGSKYDVAGSIKFSDMTVNETTGTVTLRSEFPNQDGKILPGMFVKPQLTLGYIKNAKLVPQQGITSNGKGQYTAKILKPDNTIEYRQDIQVYTGINGYWVVTKGIDIGEQVITTGLLNLTAVEMGKPMTGQIVGEPATLTQEQLDNIIKNSVK